MNFGCPGGTNLAEWRCAAAMKPELIQSALADITAEQDPTLKSLKMASLCSALWAERGVELVVVGGSAIEILTEGAYASGDLDLCHTNKATLPLRERQEVMGQLGARGGPRNWEVAGMYVDGPGGEFRPDAVSPRARSVWRGASDEG
jgi:hypothetical protein